MTDAILTIGTFDCNDGVNTHLFGSDYPGQPFSWNTILGGDLPAQGKRTVGGYMAIPFNVRILGSSPDDLEAWVNALRDQVPGCDSAPETNTAVIGLPGRTLTGALTVHASPRISVPVDVLYLAGERAEVTVTLVCDPYVLGALQALYTASGIDAPALVSLASQTGQYDTPLDLLLDAGVLELAGGYVGHTDDETAVIGDFVKALGAATWSAGAASTDAAGWPAGAGNTIWRHTAAAYTTVDVTALPAGEYLVLANCKGTTANTDTIRHQYGDDVLIPSTTLRWLPLGTVSLPTRRVRGAALDTLTLHITGGGTGEYAAVNAVAFLPATNGVTGYALASGHVHALRWESGVLYTDDAVDLANVKGSSSPLSTLGGQLVVLAEQATAAPTTHLHVTASATPRWEQLPSSGVPVPLPAPGYDLGPSM